MAQAVLSISVTGNMHSVHGHKEVTGLGELLERPVDFQVQTFPAFLVKLKNIIYNSPENKLLMIFSGQKVISKRLIVLKYLDSKKLCFSRKCNQTF